MGSAADLESDFSRLTNRLTKTLGSCRSKSPEWKPVARDTLVLREIAVKRTIFVAEPSA